MYRFVTSARTGGLARSALALALALALTGCQIDVGTLDIRLVYNASNADPFNPERQEIERLRIRVEGEGIGTRISDFPIGGDRRGSLADVPVGERIRVQVEGLDDIGTPRYRGVSAVIETLPGENQIYLFFSRIGEFSAPPTVQSAIAPDWRARFRTELRPGLGRAFHTASVLSDGSLLLTGGSQTIPATDHLARLLPGQALFSAERFDPTAGAFFKDAAFCADVDGDGYGSSPDCLGMDCDDSDAAVHEGCSPGCQDADLDGYGNGGDCLGSDCDDADQDCAFGACCGECPTSGGLCLAAARAHHAALPLADPDLWLVLGGEPGGLQTSAETYRVSEQRFAPKATLLSQNRTRLAAALVGPEMLIVAGGIDPASDLTARIESAGQDLTFRNLGDLRVARAGAVAVSYPGGALVIGGWEQFGGDIADRRASTAIDRITVSGGVVSLDNHAGLVLRQARAEHSAVAFTSSGGLPRVLVCGGLIDGIQATSSCEVIKPAEAQVDWFNPLDPLHEDLDVARWRHTATLLPSGEVLIAGGFFPGATASAHNRAVIINLKTGQLEQLVMRGRRGGHTATLMPNDMVLLAGGLAGPGQMASPAYEIFNP